MKKLTLEDIRRIRKNENDRIRRANKKFAEATKAERRVIVAKDVLAQLIVGKIKAKRGEYLVAPAADDLLAKAENVTSDWSSNEEKKEGKEAGKQQLCDVFKSMDSCDACALGSVFVSAVIFMDKLKVKDFVDGDGGFGTHLGDDSGMRKYLGRVFDLGQLHMIENAFEGSTITTLYKKGHGEDCECKRSEYGDYTYCDQDDEELEERCNTFCGKTENARKRLEKVMQNVVDNKGTFVP